MSERDRLTEAAAALLRRADPTPPPPPSDNDRMRAVIAMENARDQQRRRRLRQVAAPLLAAAAVLLAIGFGRQLLRRDSTRSLAAARGDTLAGSAVLIRESNAVPLGVGALVTAGDRVVTTDGLASLTLPSGTLVTVDRATDLAVVSSGNHQSYFVATGAIHARVVKLRAGERFVVQTTDAEVEVRGTAFRVARVSPDPKCSSASTTRVFVEEGVVTVRALGTETRVATGESWPSGCAAAMAPPTALVSAQVAPIAPIPLASSTPSAAPPLPAPPAPLAPKASAPSPTSDLAEQNDLFGGAMANKQAGDARGAVAKLERLLAKYPGTALAEQATAERFKLLATYDRKRARDAAEAYLARYPKGYARADAKAFLDKP